MWLRVLKSAASQFILAAIVLGGAVAFWIEYVPAARPWLERAGVYDRLGIAPADLPAEERARLADFIQYFERITRRMLAGGITADVVVKLDRNRVPGPIAG